MDLLEYIFQPCEIIKRSAFEKFEFVWGQVARSNVFYGLAESKFVMK